MSRRATNSLACANSFMYLSRATELLALPAVTLPMMICAYNRGLRAPCDRDDIARDVPYVTSVLECMANLGTVKPDDPGVVHPPKEAE